MTAWLAEHGARLPKLLVDEYADILALIDELTDRVTAKTKLLASLASASETARRLQTMPGVGPMTALAVEAFAPNMQEFRSGRDFAAWLGLVPKQHSSGGKERLGRVSKASQTDIRQAAHHWSDVSCHRARCSQCCRSELAWTADASQAEDAGGDRVGKRNGPPALGNADE